MKTLKIIFVCVICLSIGLIMFNSIMNQHIDNVNKKIIEDKILHAEELFELSKDKLDTLVNGEFMSRNARIDYHQVISIPNTRVIYEDWDEIKWLSSEEKNAADYLINSPELNPKFFSVSCDDGVMEAILYESPQILSIFYVNENCPPYIYNGIVRDLGNNYYIVIYGPLKRY